MGSSQLERAQFMSPTPTYSWVWTGDSESTVRAVCDFSFLSYCFQMRSFRCGKLDTNLRTARMKLNSDTLCFKIVSCEECFWLCNVEVNRIYIEKNQISQKKARRNDRRHWHCIARDIRKTIFERLHHFHHEVDICSKSMNQKNHLAIYSDFCRRQKIWEFLPNVTEMCDEFSGEDMYFSENVSTLQIFDCF